jgi:hypothetical protein
MSLKTFHLVFVTAAEVLAVGFAIWAFRNYRATAGSNSELILGLGSVAVAVALAVYEWYFLKKTKRLSSV